MLSARWTHPLPALLLFLAITGCATAPQIAGPPSQPPRAFDFAADTFAYPNELIWEYHFDDPSGRAWHERSREVSGFSHRCFVLARATRQFFNHAVFDPALPRTETRAYARLVKEVLRRPSRRKSPESKKIVIPGYANLREFSRGEERLLKSLSAGAWRSYVQRGHWRIMMPFTRAGQTRVAAKLEERVAGGEIPIVHLIRFPRLTINHAVLFFGAAVSEAGIDFKAYDPNNPAGPVTVTFDRTRRSFIFPRTKYFEGGALDAYEVYRGWRY